MSTEAKRVFEQLFGEQGADPSIAIGDGCRVLIRRAGPRARPEMQENKAFWEREIAQWEGPEARSVSIDAPPRVAPTLRVGSHRFALSYASTDGWRACAAAERGPIGVDVEVVSAYPELRSMMQLTGLSGNFAVDALRDGWKEEYLFARIWTAKEAVLKAAGVGLSVDPRTVRLDRREGGRAIATLHGVAWDVRWIDRDESVVAVSMKSDRSSPCVDGDKPPV